MRRIQLNESITGKNKKFFDQIEAASFDLGMSNAETVLALALIGHLAWKNHKPIAEVIAETVMKSRQK